MSNAVDIISSLVQYCPLPEVTAIELSEPQTTPEITIIQWLDTAKSEATEYLVSANADTFTGNEQHLHFECRAASSLGLGLTGRESPNNIVVTKFHSQDDSKTDQSNVGVKKVDADNTETLMSVL